MSFLDCMKRAIDDGATTKDRAQATQDAWRLVSDRYAQFHDRRTAEEMAYEDIRDAFKRDTAAKRHARIADLTVMRRNVAEVIASDDLVGVVRRPIERAEGAKDQPDSAWFTMKALEQQFQGMMSSFFSAINRDIVGRVRKPTTLKNVARELHDETTGDAVAAAMSQAIRQTYERMRLLFNEAGGHISKLEDWGLPHTHDRKLLQAAGREAWTNSVIGRLDWSRIENYATGRPFGGETPDAIKRSFLRDVYQGIVFNNVPSVKPRYGPPPGSGRLGDQHAYQRILHFKGADDWMSYNDEFGSMDVFGSISAHMHRMARDIALMRSFGTNPRAGLEHRFQVALQEAKKRGDPDLIQKLQNSIGTTRGMLDQVTGTAATPENEWWANFFSGVRMWLTSSYLGSAMLASGGDWAAMRMAAKTMGMNPNNVLATHTRLMASSLDRETASQIGYIADTLTDGGNTLARFLNDVPSNEILERLTSFTMRAQGLSYWTDMGRTAFRMEMTGLFARNAGRKLADVDPDIRDVMISRGVTAEDWAEFSDPSIMFTAPNGAKFLSPTHWLHHTKLDPVRAEGIAIRMGSIIEEQVEFAVPTMSVRARAAVQGQAKPGTLQGEIALSGLSFKSFAMSIWINQTARIMSRPTTSSKAKYAAEMLAAFTLMGAIGVQLKEMSKGNDPRPMDSAAFWGAAALQGGGLGIVGDLVSASTTRLGGGLPGYLGGPVVGMADQLGNLTLGNAMQAIRGEDMNFGRDLSRFVSSNTPVASSLWQTRAALDRMVFDQMQLMLDPEAARSFRTRASNRERDFGNKSFWQEGEMLPSRAPDLGVLTPG